LPCLDQLGSREKRERTDSSWSIVYSLSVVHSN
jgi:hypothetical protein